MAIAVALLCATGLSVRAEIEAPPSDPAAPIRIAADTAQRWREGVFEVWLVQGNVLLQQGLTYARAQSAVFWIERQSTEAGPSKVISYLEGTVEIDYLKGSGAKAKLKDSAWFGRFYTAAEIEVRTPPPGAEPADKPAIYQRAMVARDPNRFAAIRRAQFEEPAAGGGPVAAPPAADALPPGTRRLRAYRRSSTGVSIKAFDDPASGEIVAVISGGINLVIDGVQVQGLSEVNTIDIATDRMIIWTRGVAGGFLGAESFQAKDAPLEIYMEGNIEFRSGDRIVYANRMYYDVKNETGTVLDAEVLTPVPSYTGLLRVKAAIVQQIAKDRFVARNSFVTSSRMGQPTYRLQTEQLLFEDRQQVAIDPRTGAPQVDNLGQPVGTEHDQRVTSTGNYLYLGDVPVFYWPSLSTRVEDPSFYVKRARFGNDNVFGTKLQVDLNAYQIFGFRDPPEGTDWELSLDYLSDRGLGHGTKYKYALAQPAGPVLGFIDFWGILDDGRDNLGRDRRAVLPAEDYRYRVLGQHRELFANNLQFSAELGWISDRNFLEQYYENEWDEFKDQTTGVELKQITDNMSWSLAGDVRLNNFFSQTEGVRLDHYWLGQELLGETLTWFEHSQAAYLRLRTAAPNATPESVPFALFPGEASRSGERFVTRQELDLPFALEEVKVVPYVLGEAAHWGEDLSGDSLSRLYGQAGVRASLPMWRVFPEVESQLFNVHGVAHKVVFDAELAWSDASRDLEELPEYDPLDDDSIEHFRRRFYDNTFGVASPDLIPAPFDPRHYAVRSGLGSWVTSPATEVVDDLLALRAGMRHRWQTKRGLPGQRHTVDFLTLDTNLTFFPKDDRDNFGQPIGLVDYDVRWHVGDRVTLLSRGAFDFFEQGQQVISVGAFFNRPPRGNFALHYTYFEGPFSSQIVNGSFTYRLGPKWLATFGASLDIVNSGNIGQRFSLTRIGESFLVSLGGNIDASKGNVGLQLVVEPRFTPRSQLGNVGGAQIPPAGAFGLE